MYLINTSFHAEKSIAPEVIDKVRDQLRDAMEGSGVFSDIIMAEILVEADPDCVSFALQGQAADIDKAMEWLRNQAHGVFSDLHRKYNGKVVYFTTPMRIL